MSLEQNAPSGALISTLVDALEPVRPLSLTRGLGLVLAGLGVTVAVAALLFGVRPDVMAGRINPVFLLATGLYLLLGAASAVTVIDMARPRVGLVHGGWIWAAVMAAVLPVTAIIIGLGGATTAFSATQVEHGLACLTIGGSLALLTFASLVRWLRQGAPTSPERAGLLTGIAAGCFGIFAFSLSCGYTDIVHIGLWHSSVVVLCAVIGRLAVPPLVRW